MNDTLVKSVFLWKHATVKRISDNKFNAYYNGDFIGVVSIDPRSCKYNDKNTMSQAVKTLAMNKGVC